MKTAAMKTSTTTTTETNRVSTNRRETGRKEGLMASTSYLSTMSTSGIALTLGAGQPAVADQLLREGLERDRAELAKFEALAAMGSRYHVELAKGLRDSIARSEAVLENLVAVA